MGAAAGVVVRSLSEGAGRVAAVQDHGAAWVGAAEPPARPRERDGAAG